MEIRRTFSACVFIVLMAFMVTSCGGGGASGGGENTPQSKGGTDTTGEQGEPADVSQGSDENAVDDQPEEGTVTPQCVVPTADPSTGEGSFAVGPITARYFHENDGQTPGVGTDGSDTSINPQFVAEQELDRVAVNYSRDEHHGIDSYGFYGVYEGTIDVYEDNTTVYANISTSYSDVSFQIGDDTVERWSNCDRIIPLSLDAGSHPFRVELHSHYHAANLNVSFTNYKQIPVANARYELGAEASEGSKVWYVGTYSADTLDNSVTVTIPATADNVILALGSYEAVNWVIHNPHGTNIAAVLFNAYAPGSTVTGNGDAPAYHVTDMAGGYSDFSSVADDLRQITGNTPHYVYGESSLAAMEINAGNNQLDQSVVGGAVFTLLDTYTGINEINHFAESTASGQQLATYLPIRNETVITRLKWNGRTNPSQFSAPGPQAFIIRVYEGEHLPDAVFAEEVVMVPPSLLYESTLGDVYDFTYSDSGIFTLPGGNYWISIVDPESQSLEFLWTLEGDTGAGTGGAGGAFRPTFEDSWRSTVLGIPADIAIAASIYVEGVEVAR